MITEDYVSRGIAILLKEKGFHEPVRYEYHYYNTTPSFHRHFRDFNGEEYKNLHSEWYSAPTLQMAMKWLREIHHLAIIISPQWAEGDMRNTCTWRWEIRGLEATVLDAYDNRLFGFTYEDTVEIALRYALNHLI